jgi:hypothetical protein
MTDAAAGIQPASGQEAVKPAQTIEQKYLRETRNAAVFIAVVVGIVSTLSLIAVIVVGSSSARSTRS